MRLKWLEVADNYRKLGDNLQTEVELNVENARLLKKLEEAKSKYQDLVLRNVTLTKFLRELKIRSWRLLGVEKETTSESGSESWTEKDAISLDVNLVSQLQTTI